MFKLFSFTVDARVLYAWAFGVLCGLTLAAGITACVFR